MDKQQKGCHSYHHPTHKVCQVCKKETESDCQFTEMAQYSKQTSNLIMIPKLACQPCRQQIQSVRYYVEANQLSFGKCSKIYRDIIQPYYISKPPTKIQQENTLYQRNIQQQIKRSKIYHEGSLPQNYLQLVYYCSFGISQGERHQRIKNTIKRVMSVSPIAYANLADISVLVHCLTCFMTENHVVELMRYIMDRILVVGSPYSEETEEDYGMPFQPLWHQLTYQVNMGNLIVGISLLLRNWPKFKQNLKKLKSHPHIITLQNLSHNYQLPSSNTKIQQNTLQSCPKCHSNSFPYLRALSEQKNMMSMILKTMVKQQNLLNEHIKQLQEKHSKQKEEYINKIIKLKDKIQILEKNDDRSLPDNINNIGQYQEKVVGRDFQAKKTRKRRSRSITEDGLGLRKKYTVGEEKTIMEVEETSQAGSHQIIQGKFSEENGNETQPSGQNFSKQTPPKIQIIPNTQFRQQLHRLVVLMPELDPSLLQPTTDIQILLNKIEQGMLEMQQKIQAFQKKNRTLELQSKRLLGILTRKQERFIPLIHQKDEIIQKYQNALWKMQNLLPVEDQQLGPRIQTIINRYKQDILQTLTLGTNIDPNQDFNDSFLQPSSTNTKEQFSSKSAQKSMIESPTKQSNSKEIKSQKRRTKKKSKTKSGQQEKDCVIF